MVLVGDIVVGGRGRRGQGDGYKAEEGDGELHVGLCCLVGWSVGGWVSLSFRMLVQELVGADEFLSLGCRSGCLYRQLRCR